MKKIFLSLTMLMLMLFISACVGSNEEFNEEIKEAKLIFEFKLGDQESPNKRIIYSDTERFRIRIAKLDSDDFNLVKEFSLNSRAEVSLGYGEYKCFVFATKTLNAEERVLSFASTVVNIVNSDPIAVSMTLERNLPQIELWQDGQIVNEVKGGTSFTMNVDNSHVQELYVEPSTSSVDIRNNRGTSLNSAVDTFRAKQSTYNLTAPSVNSYNEYGISIQYNLPNAYYTTGSMRSLVLYYSASELEKLKINPPNGEIYFELN